MFQAMKAKVDEMGNDEYIKEYKRKVEQVEAMLIDAKEWEA